MITPKLYLIESEEREGLVKIGLTGVRREASEAEMVQKRIQEYLAGISDPSTIYETAGSKIFEKYLHEFFRDYRKSIPLTFKFWDKQLPGPQEWFDLEANIFQALRETFSQESYPSNVNQVDFDDLPVFLSGVFSAMQWEAKFTDPKWLDWDRPFPISGNDLPIPSTMPQKFDLQDKDSANRQPNDPLQTELQIILAEDRPHPTSWQKTEITQIRDMEASRTVIGIVAILCVLYLSMIGAPLTTFALFSLLLLVVWPFVYHKVSQTSVIFWNWLQVKASRARQKAAQDD